MAHAARGAKSLEEGREDERSEAPVIRLVMIALTIFAIISAMMLVYSLAHAIGGSP